ncbi:MAG: glycosyltransferase family 2 protein [Candidatus Nanopelagicaceae bacterium]
MSLANAQVTAILVVHDGATWLPKVVAAIASQSRTPDKTIAVDTGSNDGSTKLLSGARIKYLSIDRGEGFGTAVAEAVASLPPCESEDEWIWLIHDDSAPDEYALEKLLESVADRPNVAMVGPKILGWNDRKHLLEVGVSIARNGARWTGLEDYEYDQGQHDGIREVLSVSTAGALIRRSVFEELGGFDEKLDLFRDDVDFGWRIHAAGQTVLVNTDAVIFHAQAAASERRSVDVDEAFLHRPLLLDRRNAAYVLLTNSTWWMLPLVAIQVVGSALLRAIGYLIAKLPGYASDELLALGRLFTRPDLVRAGRKWRKEDRLVSPRVVTRFMPSRGAQFRSAIDSVVDRIQEKIFPAAQELSAEFVEDEDLLTPNTERKWRQLFKRPELSAFIAVFLFSILFSRSRFGAIAGGALPETPNGVSELWRLYGESWHQVGLGSASATPTWVAVIALIGTITLGNAQLFVSALFLFAPFLLFAAIFIWLKKITSHIWLAIFGSALYALSPVALASVNAGRIGTLIVMISLPLTLHLLSGTLEIEKLSIRKIFQLGLFLAIPVAFSLPFLMALSFFYVGLTAFDYLHTTRPIWISRIKHRALLLAIPFLINTPFSTEALLHPSRFLLEPGLALAGGGPNLALLATPGGIGAVPWWLFGPFSLLLLVANFSRTNARYFAFVGTAFLFLGSILAALSFPAHGTSIGYPLWSGTFIAVSTVAAVTAGAIVLDQLRKHLEKSALNYRHILAALLLAASVAHTAVAAFWSIATTSPLHTISSRVLPEFLGVVPGTKTMVIRKMEGDVLNFFTSRGSDIKLGDPDVAPAVNLEVSAATRNLFDGSGITSSATLAEYGIKYLFVKSPAPASLVTTIDGIGGFIRNSATSAGVTWRVSGNSDRLVFFADSGKVTAIPTNKVSANFELTERGTLRLAENYDRNWKLIGEGRILPKTKNENGLPEFRIEGAGKYLLIHDGTARRAWLSLQIIFILVGLVMAAPGGRRRRDQVMP